jgi:hypothetical protein
VGSGARAAVRERSDRLSTLRSDLGPADLLRLALLESLPLGIEQVGYPSESLAEDFACLKFRPKPRPASGKRWWRWNRSDPPLNGPLQRKLRSLWPEAEQPVKVSTSIRSGDAAAGSLMLVRKEARSVRIRAQLVVTRTCLGQEILNAAWHTACPPIPIQ